jgi:phosphate transport system substrate-binding protein
MKRFSASVRWLVPAAVVVGLVASSAVGAGASNRPARLDPATLTASGSTLAQPFYQEVIGAFQDNEPDVSLTYAGGGSGKGRQDFADQTVDFAGSDTPFKPEDTANVKGGDFLYFPTVASPIAVSYNLERAEGLRLSADTIAKIFQRQITTWDDGAIKAENRRSKIPSTPITVVHRADESGTTEDFTQYLTAAASDTWTLGSGPSVDWPTDTQAAPGNRGVGQLVKDTPGAIGYLDFADAKALRLPLASIKNKDGRYVAPSARATSAALAKAELAPDVTYNPLDAPGRDSYPLADSTFLLVYKNQADQAKADAIKAFLTFVYGPGQKIAPAADYAPLPKTLLDKAKAQVKQITVAT